VLLLALLLVPACCSLASQLAAGLPFLTCCLLLLACRCSLAGWKSDKDKNTFCDKCDVGSWASTGASVCTRKPPAPRDSYCPLRACVCHSKDPLQRCCADCLCFKSVWWLCVRSDCVTGRTTLTDASTSIAACKCNWDTQAVPAPNGPCQRTPLSLCLHCRVPVALRHPQCSLCAPPHPPPREADLTSLALLACAACDPAHGTVMLGGDCGHCRAGFFYTQPGQFANCAPCPPGRTTPGHVDQDFCNREHVFTWPFSLALGCCLPCGAWLACNLALACSALLLFPTSPWQI
jgi:hypothetical protein